MDIYENHHYGDQKMTGDAKKLNGSVDLLAKAMKKVFQEGIQSEETVVLDGTPEDLRAAVMKSVRVIDDPKA